MSIQYNYKLLREILSKKRFNIHELDSVLHELSDRVFNRLDFIKIEPKSILECGYGAGYDNQLLRNKFSNAEVYNLDIVKENLPRNKSGILNKLFTKAHGYQSIAANCLEIPLKSNSVDLIYANQVIPYIDDIEKYIKEIFRVLNIGGTCLLSGLGVDSFKELREYGLSTFRFPDMHDIGDMLLDAGFSNPVVDTEYLNIQYDTLAQALNDLRIVGAGAANSPELRKYISKECYKNIQDNLNQPISITLEIFVVHGWKDKIKLDLPDGVSPISFNSKLVK